MPHTIPDGSGGDDGDWVPTGLQTISTHQYRDGDKLITKQRILEEYETGVEPYYKNPEMRDKLESGILNESFDRDEAFRLANICLDPALNSIGAVAEEQRRVKL